MREIKKIDENSYLGFKNVVYRENYKNYEIFILEMRKMALYHYKWYNGYIVIPEKSKFNQMTYVEIDKEIDIHGGFTFSEFIGNEYIIGFDTAHIFDDKNTQNVDFVLNELKNAVDQIIEKEKE